MKKTKDMFNNQLGGQKIMADIKTLESEAKHTHHGELISANTKHQNDSRSQNLFQIKKKCHLS